MFLDVWGHAAPAEVIFSLPPEHSEYFSLFILSDVSSTCHLNVVRLCLRDLWGDVMVCVYVCVCVCNWGVTADKTDSPAWAVGGRWRLDVAAVQGSLTERVVTVTTRGVGRASCHSTSADNNRDVCLRSRPNLQLSSRRQSSEPTLYLVTFGEVQKNRIRMKVEIISCAFELLLTFYPVNKRARHVFFFKDLCRPFATCTEFQMIKLKGSAALKQIRCAHEAWMTPHNTFRATSRNY